LDRGNPQPRAPGCAPWIGGNRPQTALASSMAQGAKIGWVHGQRCRPDRRQSRREAGAAMLLPQPVPSSVQQEIFFHYAARVTTRQPMWGLRYIQVSCLAIPPETHSYLHPDRRPVTARIGSPHQHSALRVANDELDFPIIDARPAPCYTMPQRLQTMYRGLWHLRFYP